MNTSPFHIQIIRERFSQKQRANPAYSLRAYSRDLGMDASTLSQVLNGRRPLPLKDCDPVATRLRLAPRERMQFIESACARKTPILDQLKVSHSDDRIILDESHYRIIAEWEHFAALTLADIPDFRLTSASVAKKLGLTRIRAESVVQNLLNAGLLIQEPGSGKLTKAQSSVRTTEDIQSNALRDSHLETLELGKKKLDTTPVELRDFSTVNIALDPDQLIELKAIVREFRQKVSALAKAGKNRRDIYQMAIQLYPLSITQPEEDQPCINLPPV